MNLQERLQEKRAEILALAAKYGASNIRVFGSVARGEADADSDVDFLVEMQPGRSLLDMGGLLMELQELLGCRVDIMTEKGLRRRIRQQVLGEAIPL
ncbi:MULTISPECIES: nucleotidyltransferase family protein [Oscillatoriales]|uniref:Nucleotidyltransferase family protein n=2 Tax=Oscillatoriales TaxID=1150 RepID=A0ABT2MRV9_9CYAN|nr:nucleotidyltransferase family protein [Oscillatoria acuminata]AFY80899.1 putative nucleotidyltransferase [Oscillatoria acuminata PCC 6304]MCT7967468.1 nucleotidyltransferase family protein [Laspinema sp. D2a]